MVVIRQLIDDHVEPYALDTSDSDRLGFGGSQVRMVLVPADQILRSFHHVGCARLGRLIDLVGYREA
jgi:hypothetical protein